jgi:hypothetical protein
MESFLFLKMAQIGAILTKTAQNGPALEKTGPFFLNGSKMLIIFSGCSTY